jgi:hypothetical protein
MKTQIFLSALATIGIATAVQAGGSQFCSNDILVNDIVGQYIAVGSVEPYNMLINVGYTGVLQNSLGLGATSPSAQAFYTLTWTPTGYHTYTGVLNQLEGIATPLPGDTSLGVFPMTHFQRNVTTCNITLSSDCKTLTVSIQNSCNYVLNANGSSKPATCTPGGGTLVFTKDLSNPNTP